MKIYCRKDKNNYVEAVAEISFDNSEEFECTEETFNEVFAMPFSFYVENDILKKDEEKWNKWFEEKEINANCKECHILLDNTDYKMAQGFERVLDCKTIEELLETLATFSTIYKQVIDERKEARTYIQEHE